MSTKTGITDTEELAAWRSISRNLTPEAVALRLADWNALKPEIDRLRTERRELEQQAVRLIFERDEWKRRAETAESALERQGLADPLNAPDVSESLRRLAVHPVAQLQRARFAKIVGTVGPGWDSEEKIFEAIRALKRGVDDGIGFALGVSAAAHGEKIPQNSPQIVHDIAALRADRDTLRKDLREETIDRQDAEARIEEGLVRVAMMSGTDYFIAGEYEVLFTGSSADCWREKTKRAPI